MKKLDTGIIKPPLKILSELRKYIQQPRVVEVRQFTPKAPKGVRLGKSK